MNSANFLSILWLVDFITEPTKVSNLRPGFRSGVKSRYLNARRSDNISAAL